MKQNLLIGVLGKNGSGKSYTWKALFGRRVNTGKNLRRLYLNENEYVEVFLINGSPGERHKYVGEIIKVDKPRIVLCSLLYSRKLTETLNYFSDNDFSMYIHYLNPGYCDDYNSPLFYNLRIINDVLSSNSVICIRDAKVDIDDRLIEIKDFIYGWANRRGLLCTKKKTKKENLLF